MALASTTSANISRSSRSRVFMTASNARPQQTWPSFWPYATRKDAPMVARGFQLVQLRGDVACEQRSEQRAIHDGVQGLFVLQATNLIEAGGAFESAKKQLDFPPQAIQLRDVVWRKVGTGKRGQVVAVLATE